MPRQWPFGQVKSGLLILLCLSTLAAHRDSLLPVPGQLQEPVVIGVGGKISVPSGLSDLSDLSAVGGGAGPGTSPDGGPESNESPQPIEAAATLTQPSVVPGSTLVIPDAATALPVPTVAPEATPPFPINPTPTPIRSFLPGPAASVAIPTPQPTEQAVNIVLISDAAAVSIGDQLSVAVRVNAGPGNAVDAAQVYLDFDAAVLQVENLTGSSALSEELQSRHDNSLGQIDFAAGTLDAPITSSFQLLVVQFRALAQTGPGGTTIRFASLVNPRQTKVVNAGINSTGSLGTVNLTIR